MNNAKWWIIGVVGSLLLFTLICKNAVVRADNGVENAAGNLESTYQRRLDLVPNLVRVVEAAAAHEQRLQETVTRLRTAQETAARTPTGTTDAERERYDAAQRQLGFSIRATLEAYPQVRATENFRDLQAQIEGTENRINVARRDYNAAVQTYNNTIEAPPTSWFAGGRRHRRSFEAARGAEQAPVVQFGNTQPATQ